MIAFVLYIKIFLFDIKKKRFQKYCLLANKKYISINNFIFKILDPIYGNKNPSFIHYASPAIIAL